MVKKIPQRTCISCRKKKTQSELIRIVHNKNGEIDVDKTNKMEGRGAYICDNIDCFEKMKKTRILEKTFNKKIDEEVYEKLRGVIIDK